MVSISAAAALPVASPTIAALAPPPASARAWPACAALAGRKIELPPDFAPGFPFPGDIRFIRFVGQTSGAYTQLGIVGITPLGLREADTYIQAGLASANYRLTGHDSERSEADGLFRGNGWVGSYQVRVFEDCALATLWTVQVLKL